MSLRRASYVKIGDLRPDSKGVNLVAKVISVEVVHQRERPDGSRVVIAEAVIADETGCITFTLRNDNSSIVKPGGNIVVRNALIEMYKSHMRLIVNVWGKVSTHPDGIPSTPSAPSTTDTSNNLSEVEYELVTVE